jgi:hypothetical protein
MQSAASTSIQPHGEASRAGNAVAEVRSLRTSDIPGVAQLFQSTFRNSREPAPASLLDYIEQIFLDHPWQDDSQTSKVAVSADGMVAGFIGILPQRLIFDGHPVRASVVGTLMSHDPKNNPLVGARLLRSALSGGQDLSFSESANPLALRMWEKAGGVVLPLYSLTWFRLFRPATFSVAMLTKRQPRAAAAQGTGRWWRLPLAGAAFPLTSGMDRLIQWVIPGAFSAEAADGQPGKGFGVDAGEFAAAVPALCERYQVRPQWDSPILTWLLEHAALKAYLGPTTMRLVKDRGGRIVGGYIYHGRERGIGTVLQIFSAPNAERLVVAELFAHAADKGMAAMTGRVQPEHLDALVGQRAILLRRGATVVHTRNRELLAPLLTGDALVTGLAAEAWCRLVGHEFS